VAGALKHLLTYYYCCHVRPWYLRHVTDTYSRYTYLPSAKPTPVKHLLGNARYTRSFSYSLHNTDWTLVGPILWGHSGPLCHALSSLWTSILHCHSPGVATVTRRLRYSYSWLWLILVVVSTVATPGEWQCKISTCGVRRLAVANGPNIFQMLIVFLVVSTYIEVICVVKSWASYPSRFLSRE